MTSTFSPAPTPARVNTLSAVDYEPGKLAHSTSDMPRATANVAGGQGDQFGEPDVALRAEVAVRCAAAAQHRLHHLPLADPVRHDPGPHLEGSAAHVRTLDPRRLYPDPPAPLGRTSSAGY